MEKVNKFFATTALGGFLKVLIGFAVSYLMTLYATDGNFDNFNIKAMGTIVLGSALPIVYNFLNPSDERYGVGRPNK